MASCRWYICCLKSLTAFIINSLSAQHQKQSTEKMYEFPESHEIFPLSIFIENLNQWIERQENAMFCVRKMHLNEASSSHSVGDQVWVNMQKDFAESQKINLESQFINEIEQVLKRKIHRHGAPFPIPTNATVEENCRGNLVECT